jgi:uncharacterized membrane protein YidH (DUF202 family)
MLKKIHAYFSKPVNLAILNGFFIVLLILFNTCFQAFCIPSNWAIIVLAICFANLILYPLLADTKFAPLFSFINGVSVFVFVYCVIFLEQMNIIGLALILVGLGLVTFIPHFFIVQLIWKSIFKQTNKISKYLFLTAIFLCTVAVILVGYEYKRAIQAIDEFKDSNYTQLDKSFMTEKILGMHFIYHTRFCEFDGWRPPKHEPILVIGMWLNNRKDPLNVSLEKRLELYKKFFPENEYKFDCSCGVQYRHSYHNDPLWKK